MTDANVLEYTYNSDKLNSFDGNLCEYDALGNPILYRNKSLKWNNLRNLSKFGTIEFTYNANGIRTKKVNGNHESKYYYLDNRLLSEKRDIHSSDLSINDYLYEGEIYYTYTDKTDISYMYNANELTSFTIAMDGMHQTYYYRKNLQGDSYLKSVDFFLFKLSCKNITKKFSPKGDPKKNMVSSIYQQHQSIVEKFSLGKRENHGVYKSKKAK